MMMLRMRMRKLRRVSKGRELLENQETVQMKAMEMTPSEAHTVDARSGVRNEMAPFSAWSA
jgi:hypothetical protein